MIKLFIVLLLAVGVSAANPRTYAGVGDPVYDAMPQIETLLQIESMRKYRQGISDFLKACQAAKEAGLAIDGGYGVESDRKEYLHKLRLLTREYDFFVGAAHNMLQKTMDAGDYGDFSKLVKSGLVDTAAKRQEAMEFYTQHHGTDRIEVIEGYLSDEQARREREMSEKEKRRAEYERYKKIRLEQINRRQKEAKAAQRKEIEQETDRQKQEAYRMQQEELQRTR